jgi:chromosome segregation ATPase
MAHPPPLPALAVRLEVRNGTARPVSYDVTGDEFVVGTVPGCDLRVSGANLPPVLCVIARHADGARLRKLAPNLPLLLNGQPVDTADLKAGDTIALGPLSIAVEIAAGAAPRGVGFVPVSPHQPSRELQEAELAERRRKFDAQVAETDGKQKEIDRLRAELTESRRDLHRQYQERRDRLAGLQQSVQTAARKVQEQKQKLDADGQSTAQAQKDLASRLAAVEQREREVDAARRAIDAEHQRRQALYADTAKAIDVRLVECDKREKYLVDRDARSQVEWTKIEQQRVEVERREKELAARDVDLEARGQRLAAGELALRQREAHLGGRDETLSSQQSKLDADRQSVEKREAEVAATKVELDRRAAEMEQQSRELAARQQEVNKLRDEHAAAQKDLHQRYQERRDRLAGLQQAVQVAAGKVQESKRELAERHRNIAPRFSELDTRAADLDRREQELAAARTALDTARQEAETAHGEITARLRSLAEQLKANQAECDEREKLLVAKEERHRADLARLDRFQETVEQRERAADAATTDVERQREQLGRDTLELEEQARQLDGALATQKAEDERLKQQRIELDAANARLTERAAQVEGQQAMLAALRTRLERMRTEVRAESQNLAEQRVRQEAAERDLQEKMRLAEAARESIDAEGLSAASVREHFESRSTELQTAVARLRELQQKLSAEDETHRQRSEQIEAQAAEQAAQAAELTTRATQVLALQERVTADRQAVKEREAALAREEETRKSLQEQLRRRAEELAARQKQLEEQARNHETQTGQAGERNEAVEQATAAARQDLERQMIEMRQKSEWLTMSEVGLRRLAERLKTTGRALAKVKKSHYTTRCQWEADRKAAEDEARRVRAELEEYRKQTAAEAEALRKQLPDLELRGQAVLVRLGQAREELRGHLAGLHAYAGQSQEDLESLQARVRAEAERLREQERTVQRARAEHRLAVTAFRQQLIEWQGNVAEMRRVLADDGTRLERKQAEVAAAAKQVDETSQHLARQAANLHEQERQVGERRSEVERHLGDMREWYRRKLRELADSRTGERSTADATIVPLTTKVSAPSLVPQAASDSSGPSESDVLSLTNDLDPGDRQLGDLLRSLELVDADTLTSLWLEARRQRRSLRQVLLSARGGGTPLLTLYQLALIESGNVDALVLGPTRVIDRVQATARETVYRVFDPRPQGGTVLLRHLAEAEMQDAVHPDEFRQRFGALAGIADPHLAATLELLEVNGRPAVIQEWLSGLSSSEWPLLAAVPAVWHCLLTQAATGLHAGHTAGLVHGRLTPRSVVLTPSGVVKLTGCGEPPWLTGGPADATTADDLTALGEAAAAWAGISKRKGLKPSKSLPEPLLKVLARLRPDSADCYPSAADLLADLERTGPSVPVADDAWEQLVAHAAEHATDGVAWRKSA